MSFVIQKLFYVYAEMSNNFLDENNNAVTVI